MPEFINPSNLIPGRIYGTRRGDRCSKYLYLGPCFQKVIRAEIATSHPKAPDGKIAWVDTVNAIKWKPIYNKILHRSETLNQIIHDLIDLTEDMDYWNDWRQHVETVTKPMFTHEIKKIFDPADVTAETITRPWENCFVEYNPAGQYFMMGDASATPARRWLEYNLKPWTNPNQEV